MIDNKPPQDFMHLHLKMKKLQLEEEHLATIERDNHILLDKMAHIMWNRGRIDNRNDYLYKSLNSEKRQREQIRISKENKDIFQRILNRRADYSHETWTKEWRKNRTFLNNISQFPNNWWTDTKTKTKKKPDSKDKVSKCKKRTTQSEGGSVQSTTPEIQNRSKIRSKETQSRCSQENTGINSDTEKHINNELQENVAVKRKAKDKVNSTIEERSKIRMNEEYEESAKVQENIVVEVDNEGQEEIEKQSKAEVKEDNEEPENAEED
ncbi:protein kinase 4-like [Argonauta hians]